MFAVRLRPGAGEIRSSSFDCDGRGRLRAGHGWMGDALVSQRCVPGRSSWSGLCGVLLEREQRRSNRGEVKPPRPRVCFPGAQETIEAALGDSEAATVVGSLRRGEGVRGSVLAGDGAAVGGWRRVLTWGALYSGPYTIPAGFLDPTALQRESYWLEEGPRGAECSWGQREVRVRTRC